MTLRLFRTFAAFVFSTGLLASSTLAQTHPAAPESPYGGVTVEEIIARVNDQIISRSDYNRALTELDAEARRRGALMQETSAAHKDLLRNLIDQQLWLSKGKELGITGETELVNRLNEIRKQNHLDSLEDLEKAAKEQGVSYEDFKASIRNGIITQQVMREEVGRKIQFTPGEAERYFEQHKQDYAQQESVNLAEILISTGTPAPAATEKGGTQPDDPEKIAAAKAKADELEAKLHAGGDFNQLARTFSDGPTAAQGGELGQFRRGALAKVLEDQTFVLKAGQFTEPIRTRQGFVILKVLQHVSGGIPQYKDVMQQVEENFYLARMEPAMREYLTTMREQAFIDIKPGFSDTGASPRQTKPIYSAYTPPKPKKKAKAERTRFRESTRTYRQKQKAPQVADAGTEPAEKPVKKNHKKQVNEADQATLKPGKKEKIRFGQAPSKTLPSAPESKTEDASTEPQAASSAQEPEPVNALETEASSAKKTKTRFSERTKQAKQHKAKKSKKGTLSATPDVPEADEIADRQTQSQPLGLAGNTAKKKEKKSTTTGNKTRLSDRKKAETPAPVSGDVPLGFAPQPATPAPAPQIQP
jgi:peptidyl-prolyl cis-trans isomerase SurA